MSIYLNNKSIFAAIIKQHIRKHIKGKEKQFDTKQHKSYTSVIFSSCFALQLN